LPSGATAARSSPVWAARCANAPGPGLQCLRQAPSWASRPGRADGGRARSPCGCCCPPSENGARAAHVRQT
jgi:hypothetical protein